MPAPHPDQSLFTAIDTGNVTTVDALLAAGASVSSTNDMGETPLHVAVLKGNDAIIRALIARGARVDARIERQNHQYDGRTPLMNAALTNNLPIVKLLLEHGADPFVKDASGFTALTFAETSGRRTANYLRKIMNVTPAASHLSLHDAASAGLTERVVRLLDDGVAVDTRDDFGSTALHRAAMSRHADLVRVLLQRGVPVDARNARGYTALTLADSVDVMQLLLDAGADPNADIGGGLTPFLYLARTSTSDVRRFLKARMGIAPDAVDLLRDEMKTLAKRATAPEFKEVATWVGGRVNRTPAPWKRRKGVVCFHNVAIVDDALERLQAEVSGKGFTLVYIDAMPTDDGRVSLILLPTANKFAALLACGTNGINKGHDTEAVISWLMTMEAEHPFVLIGCGHDFLHGRLTQPAHNASALAERMIAFCPDMVEQADAAVRSLSRPDQIAALAAQLSSSGSFDFWWD
jgi:uncharacterized protein